MTPLVEIRNLILTYRQKNRPPVRIGPVNLDIGENEFLGIVGESGAGKSTIGLALQQLLTLRGGSVLAGTIKTTLAPEEMSWVPQDPLSALDPLFRVGSLLREIEKDETLIADALAAVRLDDLRLNSYAHELSGGMRQRLVLAMALLRKPKLIVADEPTSSLDVILQHEIMQLFQKIQQKAISLLFITHNLPLAALFCDRLVVMQRGKIVEIGKPDEIMNDPQQEYTKQLVRAVPELKL